MEQVANNDIMVAISENSQFVNVSSSFILPFFCYLKFVLSLESFLPICKSMLVSLILNYSLLD